MRRGLRFAAAGGAVALLYVAVTVSLAGLGMPFQAALVLGFVSALAAHFTLQRVFVWVHADGYALPLGQQAGRYLTVAGAQYVATLVATLFLPSVLGIRVTYVYLATAAGFTVVSFLVFRSQVFHPARSR